MKTNEWEIIESDQINSVNIKDEKKKEIVDKELIEKRKKVTDIIWKKMNSNTIVDDSSLNNIVDDCFSDKNSLDYKSDKNKKVVIAPKKKNKILDGFELVSSKDIQDDIESNAYSKVSKHENGYKGKFLWLAGGITGVATGGTLGLVAGGLSLAGAGISYFKDKSKDNRDYIEAKKLEAYKLYKKSKGEKEPYYSWLKRYYNDVKKGLNLTYNEMETLYKCALHGNRAANTRLEKANQEKQKNNNRPG